MEEGNKLVSKIYKLISVLMSFVFILFLSLPINNVFSVTKSNYKQIEIATLFDSSMKYVAPVGFHKDNPLFVTVKKSNGAACIVEYNVTTKKYSILVQENNFSFISVSPDKSKIAYMYYNGNINNAMVKLFCNALT